MKLFSARTSSFVAGLVSSASLLGCGAAENGPKIEQTGSVEQGVSGGALATAYPEAVLVDAFMGSVQVSCSGTVISPHVVVTAAICLHRFGPWRVTAPYAGGQSVLASSGAVFDWTPTNPQRHNIGVIFLPTPITLTSYPKLVGAPLADGTLVVRFGRAESGGASKTDLFVSEPLAITDGVPFGFPFEYVGAGTFEGPDQGGGVELPNHELVAISTNGVEGLVALTRIDLVVSWLREQIRLAGDSVDNAAWVDMTLSSSACRDRAGAACGWTATNNGAGYTCALRHPSWAEPWTCEPGDANWINMSDDAAACENQPGKPCGWSVTNNGQGYTCALRHPEWANGWTCER